MFKGISTLFLLLQSSMSFLFSGGEVALTAAKRELLNPRAQEFYDGGSRSLATCSFTNHVANSGISLINGAIATAFCGAIWGAFTFLFSLIGLFAIGELFPKLFAKKDPEAFLNQHAELLMRTKETLSFFIDRIVKEEVLTKEEVAERELVSAARIADEPGSIMLLPLKEYPFPSEVFPVIKRVSSMQTIEYIMRRVKDASGQNDSTPLVRQYEVVHHLHPERLLGYFTFETVNNWFLDHYDDKPKPVKASLREGGIRREDGTAVNCYMLDSCKTLFCIEMKIGLSSPKEIWVIKNDSGQWIQTEAPKEEVN